MGDQYNSRMTRVAFVIDPVESLSVKKDSTIAMICAAQRFGWDVCVTQLKDLLWSGSEVFAFVHKIEVEARFCETRRPDDIRESWFLLGEEERVSLASYDAVFMRKDPPFDMNYIYATYMLDHVERAGVLVVNKPQSLRDCNEKFYATEFPRFTPSMVVSQRREVLRDFHVRHGDVIYKKLDGMGGMSIFRMRDDDPNLNVVIETLTENESQPIMAQEFLSEIVDGDKRILIVDGEPIPYALARIPPEGETRGNLAVGGVGRPQELSESDRKIAEELAPSMVERGLLFVGIDVIGECLTEVNITCPTCIRELDAAFEIDIGSKLMSAVERRIG